MIGLVMAGMIGTVACHPTGPVTTSPAEVLRRAEVAMGVDYIQQLNQPTQNLAAVMAAVRRAGLAPEHFGAQHVGLTPWAKATALY